MAARKISNRKLSTDLHRKLSAISTCSNVSDVSNLSFKLGMDPDDFKSTVQSILGTFGVCLLCGSYQIDCFEFIHNAQR